MSEHKASGDQPAMLMCSAYDFYPAAIDIYWLRDGKKETGGVTKTDEMSEGDWYYQIHSHLQYTPKSGEKISCVVEHVSSNKPMIYDWGENKESVYCILLEHIYTSGLLSSQMMEMSKIMDFSDSNQQITHCSTLLQLPA